MWMTVLTQMAQRTKGKRMMKEEPMDEMAEVTETVDSEQPTKEGKSVESEDSSEEAAEVEEVGVRTRRQRKQMGDGSRGGKRLRSQLNELMREAERGFMATKRACGAMVSNFMEETPEEENANIWGEKTEKRQSHWKLAMREVCMAQWSTLMENP